MKAIGLVRNRLTGALERVEEVRTPAEIAAEERATIEFENEAIRAQLQAADLANLRALFEGDTARIQAHQARQAELRKRLR